MRENDDHPADGGRRSIKVLRRFALTAVRVALIVAAALSLSGGPATAPSCEAATRRPGTYNVRNFGAKGDGVADDTSAVQSAMNAAAKSARGGVVFFPSGISGNKISGTGSYGIYVASPERPNDGKHVIRGNIVTGFRKQLFIDSALHPGTVLRGQRQ